MKVVNAEVLYIFKIPLFIIISGYLFSGKSTFNEFFFGKFDGLLKPVISICLITGLIFGSYYMMVGQNMDFIKSHILRDIINIFFPLWFPVNLFITVVLFRSLIFRTTIGDKRIDLYLFFILFFVLILLNHLNIIFLYMKLSSLFYFIIFLIIGYSIRKRDLKDTLLNGYSFCFFLILFTVCVYFRAPLNVKLDLYINTFGNFFTTIIATFSGSVVILNLSKWISMVRGISSVLIQCSRGSFFILALHIVVEKIFVNPLVNLMSIGGPVIDIAKFTLIIFICISFYRAMFFTRFAKFLFLPLKSFGATPNSLPIYVNLKNRFFPKVRAFFKSKYSV